MDKAPKKCDSEMNSIKQLEKKLKEDIKRDAEKYQGGDWKNVMDDFSMEYYKYIQKLMHGCVRNANELPFWKRLLWSGKDNKKDNQELKPFLDAQGNPMPVFHKDFVFTTPGDGDVKPSLDAHDNPTPVFRKDFVLTTPGDGDKQYVVEEPPYRVNLLEKVGDLKRKFRKHFQLVDESGKVLKFGSEVMHDDLLFFHYVAAAEGRPSSDQNAQGLLNFWNYPEWPSFGSFKGIRHIFMEAGVHFLTYKAWENPSAVPFIYVCGISALSFCFVVKRIKFLVKYHREIALKMYYSMKRYGVFAHVYLSLCLMCGIMLYFFCRFEDGVKEFPISFVLCAMFAGCMFSMSFMMVVTTFFEAYLGIDES